MNLNKKQIIVIGSCCLLLIAVIAVAAFFIIKANTSNTELYVFGHPMAEFESVLKPLLKQFYSQRKPDNKEDVNTQFVKYVETNQGSNYSSTPPVEGYTHPYDFCIHLVLPEELHSEKPSVIAYSSYERDLDKYRKKYRMREKEVGLILSNIFILVLDKTELKVEYKSKGEVSKMLGEDKMDKKPNLYYWYLKGVYEAP